MLRANLEKERSSYSLCLKLNDCVKTAAENLLINNTPYAQCYNQ